MVLLVDFNMREPDGRLPALLIGAADRALTMGERVIASDGEGLECNAVISEVSPDGRYAMLETIGGSFRESAYAPAAGDVFA
jgi:hypothetical protein